MSKILLVDDDEYGLRATSKILELEGWQVVTAGDGQAALEKVRSARFDLVLTDVRMPKMGGLEFLKAMSVCARETPVILMTAFGRVEDAVWAMKMGAVDFLTKPFRRQELVELVRGVLSRQGPTRVNAQVTSHVMKELQILIQTVAPTVATVLIRGESGTGKERVARALHELSPRAGGPFIALNCAAMPESLIESELFGYEKGAFTGASQSKAGLFEAAEGGTIFLDEIGEMPLSVQSKLLRVLEEQEVRRVGATQSRKVNARVLAATHRDLRERVREGFFREDLLYRLEVITLDVPALRDHAEDIPGLVDYFLQEYSARHGRHSVRVSAEAMERLLQHRWPGNIRELSNAMERAVIFAQDAEIGVDDLPPHLTQSADAQSSHAQNRIEVPLGMSLREVEELVIRRTLEATQGDREVAAKLLGVHSRTIHRKLEKDQ